MTADDAAISRPGSAADLSRRMDRLEQNHESLAKDVASLTGIVARVELNQQHSEDLNKLRFGALDTSVGTLGTKLDNFITRINGVISGEIRLPANDALMKEWRDWRDTVNTKMELSEGKLDEQDVLNGQVRLLGKLAVLLVSGNVVAIIVAIAAALR